LAILLAYFSTAGAWQHVKKYNTQQNNRQVWCTLHNHFFGWDKVNTMNSDILTTFKSMHYSCDHKNFIFNKYCTAHVKQHNKNASLAKYNVPPLKESMKINYFKEEISDLSFASV
jgi:hypothetical protein